MNIQVELHPLLNVCWSFSDFVLVILLFFIFYWNFQNLKIRSFNHFWYGLFKPSIWFLAGTPGNFKSIRGKLGKKISLHGTNLFNPQDLNTNFYNFSWRNISCRRKDFIMVRVIAMYFKFYVMSPAFVVKLEISVDEIVCFSCDINKFNLSNVHALSKAKIAFVVEIAVFTCCICPKGWRVWS